MRTNKVKLFTYLLIGLLFFAGCKKEEEVAISTGDFSVRVDENPVMGQSLGFVVLNVIGATQYRVYFTPEHSGIAEHVKINDQTGEITVIDPDFFDYEKNRDLYGTGAISAFDSHDNETVAHFNVEIIILDVNEAPALNVQQRLDGGESPIDIYKTNASYLDSLYGKSYAGGLIAYLNTVTGKGFVVAANDQSSALIWDPNQPAGSGTAGTNTAIGNGPLNTSSIVNTIGAGSYAAQICNDLVLNSFSDWFLPCKDELTEIYNNLHLKGLGSFQNTSYWSSSETTVQTIVWYRKFDTGQEGMAGSEQLFAVRAARSF